MQRVRRDSASSTDSWSIIEQKCSPEISSADSLDTDVSDSESEVEIAEEAYDSRDSDIEVDENDLTEDEEEAEVAEEEAEERDGKSDEEEDSEEEERIPETEENIEWLTQREAMEGEGKRYVAPEKIKCSLDSYIEKKDNSRKIALFMGFSFTFFVIQNIALMYLLSFSHSHARGPPEQNWGIMKTTKAVTPFESLFQNPTLYRASLQCWFTRALKGQNGTNELKSCSKKPILESWQNLTDLYMQRSWYRQEPTVIKSPKPSKYGQTTISRQRSTFDVCKRKDSPPTLAKSLYPCDQISPMPTPPKINEPQSPFSALKSIIGQSVQRIEPVSFEKADLPIKSLFKTSPKPKPRARSFNYKIEMSPVPKMNKNVKKDLVPRLQQSPVQFKKSKSVQSHQRCPVRTRNVSKEVMVVPKEWKMTKIRKEGNFKPRKMIFKEKKRFSMKASQLMRNSSYSSDKQQCKRHEFKQFRRQLLEDKSRRRRQRLVDYKIEKPCRAIYETPVPSKKVAKLEAKIQKKIQKIEKRIQKRKASFRV